MYKCLSCKHSYFRCNGEVDKLTCEREAIPCDNGECEQFEEDIDFLKEFEITKSLLSKREVRVSK